MRGYLNHPEKTAELIQDGWYTTGDLAVIDDEGFIKITGRQSRFSKIGGEMVPHIRIEQEIARIIEDTPSDEADIVCAVTAVPDAAKGERLIVLHKPLQKSVREITDQLQQAGLPNLWIPSSNSFFEVSQIPLLGTGKLDLRAVKEMALGLCAGK
jgi:acyl-[acyl-carrier-protein]-phospholipid O-acyltransferase/long-chain-fatty-acid--[acyl-carrier-protein] ligase